MKHLIPEIVAARSLAEDLGHAYYTIEHLLAAVIVDNDFAQQDLLGFVNLHTPLAEPGDIAMPTLGVQRVAKRLAHGDNLFDAIMAEGDEAHGPHFIKKHDLTQKDFLVRQNEAVLTSEGNVTDSAYDEFLAQKVNAARTSFAEGKFLTAEQVESKMLEKKQSLKNRDSSNGEPA